VEEVQLKVDSKGRVCIPAEIREQIGDVAVLKKTSKGYLLLPGKKQEKEDFLEEFRKLMMSEPRRTGKPECVSPEEMKSIWRTKV
jgi:bifunctional DNA-binding transcriptional regulator/antitoxin component of YhaV-PrlF toxin-antitoxin module